MNHRDILDHLPAANVGSAERVLTTTVGGLLLAAAVRRGSVVAGIAGGLLVARGLTGYCPAYEAWSHRGNHGGDALSSAHHEENDDVGVASEDSFPASDPPSFNPGRA